MNSLTEVKPIQSPIIAYAHPFQVNQLVHFEVVGFGVGFFPAPPPYRINYLYV